MSDLADQNPSSRPIDEHPLDRQMDYPVEGCECSNCEYARYFDSLSPQERRRELDAMFAHSESNE
jgi:hypothetical protein